MNQPHIFTAFILLFVSALSAQSPTLTLIDNGAVTPGIDPWNGNVCLFTGNPSQVATSNGICFTTQDDLTPPQNLVVTASSSNPLVIPIDANHLNVNYSVAPSASSGIAKVFLSPIGAGETTIFVTVKDADWNTSSYYITVTVKSECQDVLLIGDDEIDPLPHTMTHTFIANTSISSQLNPDAPTIASNDDIAFFAGNCITLSPDFEVQLGGEFFAGIANCN